MWGNEMLETIAFWFAAAAFATLFLGYSTLLILIVLAMFEVRSPDRNDPGPM
jgi:hypothetical protein